MLRAKGNPDNTSLYDHLHQTAMTAFTLAKCYGYNPNTAYIIGALHDIGKASPIFQNRLDGKTPIQEIIDFPYRHEISALFFLSLFNNNIKYDIIDGIIAHHKTPTLINDVEKNRGILDLMERNGRNYDVLEYHLTDFDKWSIPALEILMKLNINCHSITLDEARKSFNEAVEYITSLNTTHNYNYSTWKGLLMSSDHIASALVDKIWQHLPKLNTIADISYYKTRTNILYPLSQYNTNVKPRHTIVTACTGSGKTDFLIRRCKGRIFYTLPFQASINSMYNRIKNDLIKDNPLLSITLQHGSSKTVLHDDGVSIEHLIFDKPGHSIKILTPYQLFSILFSVTGYESVILDLQGCDIILDEIHVYEKNIQGYLLKLIDILIYFGCNIHIGTATLPTLLYNKIIHKLGKENTYEVKLTDDELKTFNRHIVHKIEKSDVDNILQNHINQNHKILYICNRINTSQNVFFELHRKFPNYTIILLHSRFRRMDRNKLEAQLKMLDDTDTPCIIVSTQVIEVSLDISFDTMITECAPIDSLIQRFGRVNRRRNSSTIGKYKPIYVLKPSSDWCDALPYEFKKIIKTYNILDNNKLFDERNVQTKIDLVYDKIEIPDHSGEFFQDGKYVGMCKLNHATRNTLIEKLGIDGLTCILDSDVVHYIGKHKELYEIPISYEKLNKAFDITKLRRLKTGNWPFIISACNYDIELGLNLI